MTNKRKMLKLLPTVFVGMALSINVHAGTSSGGGGKGVLCHIPKTSLQVLDLFEATNVYHLQESPRKGDLRSEVLFGLESLGAVCDDPAHPTQASLWLASVIQDFFHEVTYIPAGTHLPLTNDATLPPIPTGCDIVQIAIYNDKTGIKLDPEYWGLLDARNQMVILLHEELYFYRRGYGATNSDETRRFVGWLLSTTPPQPRFSDKPASGYYHCFGGGNTQAFELYIYPTSNPSGYTISFSQLENATTLGRTTGTFRDSQSFSAIGDQRFGVKITSTLQSQTHVENRLVIFKKQAGSITMNLHFEDISTGQSSTPVSGMCELK